MHSCTFISDCNCINFMCYVRFGVFCDNRTVLIATQSLVHSNFSSLRSRIDIFAVLVETRCYCNSAMPHKARTGASYSSLRAISTMLPWDWSRKFVRSPPTGTLSLDFNCQSISSVRRPIFNKSFHNYSWLKLKNCKILLLFGSLQDIHKV